MSRPPLWWPAFFVAYQRTDRNITASAERVGKTPQVVHYHRRRHVEFRAELERIDADLCAKWVRRVESVVDP